MKRIDYLDYLRALAIIGILVIHSFDPFVVSTAGWSQPEWLVSLFISSMFRFAVPMYIVISGALLLTRDLPSLSNFYLTRLVKIGVPLLIWSGIYLAYDAIKTGSLTKETFISTVIFGQPFYLIYALIGLYIITPFLVRFIEHSHKQEIMLAGLFTLAITFASSTIELWLLADKNILPYFSFTRFTQFVGYFLLGFILSTLVDVKKYKKAFISFFILSTSCIFFLTAWLYSRYGYTFKTQIFYHYLSPLVVISTITIYSLVQRIQLKESFFTTALQNISRASLGIYFVHMLIIDQIAPVIHALAPILVANLIVLVISFAASWLVVKTIAHISPLAKVVGFS